MKKFLFVTAFIFLMSGSVYAANLSADDFLPPVQASTPEQAQAAQTVQQPDEVKEEKGPDGETVITAPTAQDAINVAAQNLSVGGGCEAIRFPSGFGWVASGTGIYNVMPNPTANLIAQRHAYQIAYMQAKKNLAQFLNEMSSTGKERLSSEFKTIVNDTDTLSNMKEDFSENIAEQVQGILRGYVVYSVNDDQKGDHGQVTVTIVATPKTMGKTQRLASNGTSADTIKDGLSSVLSELQNGLMPPVGGKTISVPQTGELAFIGFGSAVVPSNPNSAVQAKLMLNAQKQAQMRARSALCGIILGDDVSATSTLDNATQDMSKQFDEAQKDDPALTDVEGLKKLDEQRTSFMNVSLTKEQITSLRSGVLPPGVTTKTFMNPQNTIAEAVAVYIPSVSAQASKGGQDMKNARIIQQDGSPAAIPGAQPGQIPQQGPSGQVMKDADL